MSWFAVGAVAVSAVSVYASSKGQQISQQTETAELESQQKAQYSAVYQAQLDKQRETDMSVYQQNREAMRAESLARAGQANSGISGITASRQIDNVLFQSILDENFIKTQGEHDLISIRNEGQSSVSSMQLNINRSRNATLSNKQIYTGTFMSGVSAGLGAYASSGGSKKNSSSSDNSSGSSSSGSSSSGGGSK